MFENEYRRAYDSIPVKELKAEELRECANAGDGNTGRGNANRIWNGVRYVTVPALSLCLILVLVLLIGLLGDSWIASLLPFVMNTVIVVLRDTQSAADFCQQMREQLS